MAATLRLLIVEDNDALRETLTDVLTARGYHVTALSSAEEVPESQPGQHHIAILDLNLPGEDGLSLAGRLRRIQPGMGIILLTIRSTVPDKLAGYATGADLYLPKPITPEELVAAITALSRRLPPLIRQDKPAIHLDPQSGVLHVGDAKVTLRAAEVSILCALALAPESRLESWQLLDMLQKPLDDTGKRQLAVIISRLRTRLEAQGLAAPSIRAERGRGYRLAFRLTID